MHIGGAQRPSQSLRAFFRIMNATPSKARLIPLPLGTSRRLGPDDIQVALRADFLPAAEKDGAQMRGAAQVAANPVMVLSQLGAGLADASAQ